MLRLARADDVVNVRALLEVLLEVPDDTAALDVGLERVVQSGTSRVFLDLVCERKLVGVFGGTSAPELDVQKCRNLLGVRRAERGCSGAREQRGEALLGGGAKAARHCERSLSALSFTGMSMTYCVYKTIDVMVREKKGERCREQEARPPEYPRTSFGRTPAVSSLTGSTGGEICRASKRRMREAGKFRGEGEVEANERCAAMRV